MSPQEKRKFFMKMIDPLDVQSYNFSSINHEQLSSSSFFDNNIPLPLNEDNQLNISKIGFTEN